MAAATDVVLASKFKGCLVGALVGDCVGEKFELRWKISKKVISDYLTKLLSGGKVHFFVLVL